MRIGICGYGNLGRGVLSAAVADGSAEVVGVFTRRPPDTLGIDGNVPVYSVEALPSFRKTVDVLILCGGSAEDLPHMTPRYARLFHTVDSFDTHGQIPRHFDTVDAAARETRHLSLISAGWDPGIFSVARILFDAVLPTGVTHTFWGRGISQGHSDALRRLKGVLDARQYTVPNANALLSAKSGQLPPCPATATHRRICYVVPAPDTDLDALRERIVTLPEYFAGYPTEVHFVSQEELTRDHATYPHAGSVIRAGTAGVPPTAQTAECTLTLGSNPDFTGGVLLAYARAVFRMAKRGRIGCITPADVAPCDLSPRSPCELRERFL